MPTKFTSSPYWSQFVEQLDPYVPGEQPKEDDLIKLNTNENPYPPSPKVLEVFSQDLFEHLRLYPDPNSLALKKALANHCAITEENVFVGNGSDEVLALAFMTFFKQSKPLLFADISYSFYPVYCNLYDIEYQQVPLADDFTIDLDSYNQQNGGIIITNPNAPTGIAMGLDRVELLLKANTESVVIIDEAYIDFDESSNNSATTLINRYPNLLVVQTLSKSRSLAGLRVGFAMGSPELISGLDRVKNSFNSYPLDRIAEAAAVASIEDTDYFNRCCQDIIETRKWTIDQLQKLGFEVLPSSTNFVMAKPTVIVAEELFAKLREHKILVRYFNKPRISEYLRISIGTQEEMLMLVKTIKTIHGENDR